MIRRILSSFRSLVAAIFGLKPRFGGLGCHAHALAIALLTFAPIADAAPYAHFVMDARSGQVLDTQNADARLHPASLTKMMTLYVTFEAVEHGELSLDSYVKISSHAANQPPSKLGLKAGQRIQVRYLIRAAAIKSANDAATALGEAVSGSESAFAERMTRTARALGMKNTTFKNANGLTREGHLSTARDMATLGRHLFYDFPEYYNLFSRRTADADGRQIANTNRKFLDAYKGADGIKTGFTNAAGFTLVASAERGSERIIASVFGGRSTAARNEQMAKLLDIGFNKAPTRTAVNRPAKPAYQGAGKVQVAQSDAGTPSVAQGIPAGKTLFITTKLTSTPEPKLRPALLSPTQVAAVKNDIFDAVDQLTAAIESPVASPAEILADVAGAAPVPDTPTTDTPPADATVLADARPVLRPTELGDIAQDQSQLAVAATSEAATETPATDSQIALLADAPNANSTDPTEGPSPLDVALALAESGAAADLVRPIPAPVAALAGLTPTLRPAGLTIAAVEPLSAQIPIAGAAADAPANNGTAQVVLASVDPASITSAARANYAPPNPNGEVVTAVSTSGGSDWAVNVGKFTSRYAAEKALIQIAIQNARILGGGLRKVVERKGAFEANVVGLNETAALQACARLATRGQSCVTIPPGH